MIDREEIEIDSIKEGETRTFFVSVVNSFPEEVHIVKVGNSCTCTEATLEGPSKLKTGQK